MRLSARVLIVCTTLVIGTAAAPAHAEPLTIDITSASLNFNFINSTGTSLLYLAGTDGFSLTARPGLGSAHPGCCLSPGVTRTMGGVWSGNDLLGQATYNGETFTNVGNLIGPNSALVQFTSEPVTLPTFAGATTMTITAPATLNGLFTGLSAASGNLVRATLVGSGLATGTFIWLPGIQQWQPTVGSFQIAGSSDAVPEPTSILLVCLSLAGVYAATRHRQQVVESLTNTEGVQL